MKTLENTSIKIMTPGPTQVADSVYHARSLRTTNPDLDPAFYDFYRDTCRLLGHLIHTENESLEKALLILCLCIREIR